MMLAFEHGTSARRRKPPASQPASLVASQPALASLASQPASLDSLGTHPKRGGSQSARADISAPPKPAKMQ